jgi:hypothetical protein
MRAEGLVLPGKRIHVEPLDHRHVDALVGARKGEGSGEAVCPKPIPAQVIARMGRDFRKPP